MPEKIGPQVGPGFLSSETSPTSHQVPAAAQGWGVLQKCVSHECEKIYCI